MLLELRLLIQEWLAYKCIEWAMFFAPPALEIQIGIYIRYALNGYMKTKDPE